MNRALRVLLIVVVIVTAVVGIRVVDPFEQRTTTPDIDFSETPSQIAATALEQPEATSHTVTIEWNETTNDTGNDRSVSSDLVRGTYRFKYDHVDRRVRGQYPNGDQVFSNPYFMWTLEPNRTISDRSSNPTGRTIGFSAVSSVRSCQCVRVDDESEHTLVLVITDTRTSLETQFGQSPGMTVDRDENASLTLYIDKESKRLQRAVFEWRFTDDNEVRHNREGVSEYSDWEETEVERPDWASYSLEELALDVLNHERDG